MNPTTEQTLERITLYELADNIGLMYVNRSEPVAASLAIELISHVLASWAHTRSPMSSAQARLSC
ncbi:MULTISPECIES: hypothetical protein [Pseudomonas]|uniref:hypothetical protein n=1 Tax=Pseudomonas TaxID=286 RepID=UPI00089DBC3A|nr:MULTISPECIES: hypothetical protein [Pseudomonas]MBS5838156.1 hypothetical protein [Pseudomonas sp.]NMZ99688.1 hypothetical protein [Pseudomonas lundensis]